MPSVISGYKLTYHKDAVKFIAKQEKVVQERIA
jgi:mRNA interferase RelE/StbE